MRSAGSDDLLFLLRFLLSPLLSNGQKHSARGGLDLVNVVVVVIVVVFTLLLLLFCLDNHSLVDISRAMRDRSVKQERFYESSSHENEQQQDPDLFWIAKRNVIRLTDPSLKKEPRWI